MHAPGFDVVATLGRGGSAVVYEARAADGTHVALKVADRELDERERARFASEADVLRRIVHPGLVPLRDAGVLPDGRPYLAMELLRGETLAARVARGPLSEDEARRVARDVGGALSALHAASVMHRDVKPENVMLVDDGARAVLLDVGIAAPFSALPTTTTVEGRVRGTPAYMAPERLFGRPATIRSDIYELAVTLFVALTGVLPWAREEAPEERLVPRDPRALRPDLDAAIAEALLCALSTRVETRPASVAEFLAAWDAPVAVAARTTGKLAPPRATRSSRPAARPARRRRALLFALVLAPALALIGWAVLRRESAELAQAVPGTTETSASTAREVGLEPSDSRARDDVSDPAPPTLGTGASEGPALASDLTASAASAPQMSAPAAESAAPQPVAPVGTAGSAHPVAFTPESVPACALLLSTYCDWARKPSELEDCPKMRERTRILILTSVYHDESFKGLSAAEQDRRGRDFASRWCSGRMRAPHPGRRL